MLEGPCAALSTAPATRISAFPMGFAAEEGTFSATAVPIRLGRVRCALTCALKALESRGQQ